MHLFWNHHASRTNANVPGADMRRTAALLTLCGLMILAAGLILFPGLVPGSAAGRPQTVSAAEGHSFDVADLDTTCKPCQDLFNCATGAWIRRTRVTREYARRCRSKAPPTH